MDDNRTHDELIAENAQLKRYLHSIMEAHNELKARVEVLQAKLEQSNAERDHIASEYRQAIQKLRSAMDKINTP